MGKLLDDSGTSPLQYLNALAANNTPQNVYYRHAEYSLDPADVSQRATASALSNLPFGHDEKFLTHGGLTDRLVGGFQLNLIAVFQTGTPLNITGGNAYTATRPNYTPGVSVSLPSPNAQQWFNIASFQNPSDYTFGNVPRSLSHVRAPGQENFDFSIFKTTEIVGRFKFQLPAEAFNVLNHVNLGLPNTSFASAANPLVNGNGVGCGGNTNGSIGTISTAADGRSLQFAGKLTF
jgi:hypothetical protein